MSDAPPDPPKRRGDPAAELLERLKASGRLPSPPGVGLRVLALCRNGDADVAEVADAIRGDPVLTARLLRFANSAVVGAGREVTSVRDAVMIAGLRAVQVTCLGFGVPSAAEGYAPELDLARYWAESFVRASLARIIGGDYLGVEREEAFAAGLLSRVGQLAMAQGEPKVYGSILRSRAPLEWLAAERTALGVDHVELGARLLAEWELPARLVEAVRFQLEPDRAPPEAAALARTLELAGRIAPLFGAGRRRRLDSERFLAAYAAVERGLGLAEDSWRAVARRVLGELRDFSRVLDVRLPEPLGAADLFGEARREWVRLGRVFSLEATEMHHLQREELVRAGTDALTGAANRARFEQRLEELLGPLRRGLTELVLVLLDVDRFGPFVAENGGEAGELMLRRLARSLSNHLRESDLVARHGADEFAVIAPDTGVEGAVALAVRLRSFAERLRIQPAGRALGVTVSLGVVASADYERPPTSRRLLLDADAELARSKESGGNAWTFRGHTEVAGAPARARG